MNITVRDSRSHAKDRLWMTGVYRDYLNDLAPAGTGAFPVLGEIGHREPDLLASWFADSNAQVLTVLSDEQPVGFALVRVRMPLLVADKVDYTMAEFFIARQWRRRGVGQAGVRLIFDRFAGRWHIMEYTRNQSAIDFWRKVVRAYTGGKYQERSANGEVHQYFESASRVAR